MKFIDSASIWVKAGDGGDGALCFRREKYVAKGGPNGGDGGDGGNVYLRGRSGLNTLIKFQIKQRFKAKNGEPGGGSRKRGKSADDLFIDVPLGVIVNDEETQETIGEITEDKQQLIVAKGGFHGLGNARFKSSINRTPYQTSKGSEGESRKLSLELKIMAEIGLLGMPNAGKSSLLRQLSNAMPQVANYPFTTLSPTLGVLEEEEQQVIIADLPGLIENSFQGTGLGLQFLKHLTRNKTLVHVVDLLPTDESDIVENFKMIENELTQYDPDLADKPRIVVLNKSDLLTEKEVQERVQDFRERANFTGDIFQISALSGAGCPALRRALAAITDD